MNYRAWKREWRRIQRQRRRGMSLVEVMVVIAIIVTLMGIVGYGVLSQFGKAQVETTKLAMGEVAKAVDLASLKKGPPSASDGLSKVYDDQDPPKDSWGNDFIYVVPGPNGARYDIISYGSDGTEGGTGTDADIKWSEKSQW